jgi:DNA repair protein RecO
MSGVRTTPAVLLRAHPWSESSHVLRFLTPELGVVGVVARGVRSRSSKGGAPLETFARGELTLDFRPERELHGYRDFVPGPGTPRGLGRALLALAGASYLAELILDHALEEGHPGLFDRFVGALAALEEAEAEALPGIFLAAGWGILDDFGFPPRLEACVRCGGDPGGGGEEEAATPTPALARFDFEAGGLLCPRCAGPGTGARLGPGARADLERLAAGASVGALRGALAHFGFLDHYARLHLGLDRPLRSEPLVRQALPSAQQA